MNIGMEAFKYCISLTSIELPNSVTSIEGDAFYGCSSLMSITLAENITSIGLYAFTNCNISSINFKGSMNTWCNKEWSPSQVSKNYTLYINDVIQENVVIPNDVINIGIWAFMYCSSLTHITIPNSVTSIERGAFMNCNNLISIDIPNSLTSLAMQLFSGCSSLTTVTIPQVINNSYVFGEVNKTICTLYVPTLSVNLYKEANEWKDFNPILPISGTGKTDHTVCDERTVSKYMIDGHVLIQHGDKTYTLQGQEVK